MLRRGYTLLEILLATTILLLGLTAVFGVTRSAQQRSVAAADIADAQLACQTMLNELLAQQTPIKARSPESILGLPNWNINVTIYPSTQPELYVLHIIAQKITLQGENVTGMRYQLLRWIPQYRVELPQEDDFMDGTNMFEDAFP